jgi:hypothetical protein
LKRGAPLKRTGFARKLYRPGPRHISEVLAEVLERPPLRPIRHVAQFTPTFIQAPKHEYVRSLALMKAYRELACQHCGAAGPAAGVCGAHSNWQMGKGGSIKADDNRCASLCSVCHYEIDQGKAWSYEQKRSIWAHAHAKTVNLLVLRGLWPAGVPVPETTTILLEWPP